MTRETTPRAPAASDLLAHASFVRALARSILRDDHRAEDVTQDTWVVALDRPPRHGERLARWLSGVTRNLARMSLRSARRRNAREQRVATAASAPPAAEVAARLELQRLLVERVRALDDPYRTTVVLRYFDDLAPREIAVRMDVPVATVHTRLRRALERLRVDLENRDRWSWRRGIVLLAGLPPAGAVPLVPSGALAMTAKAKLTLLLAPLVLGLAAVVAVLSTSSEETPSSPTPREASGESWPGTDAAPAATVGETRTTPPDTPDEGAGWRLVVDVVDARGLPATLAEVRFVDPGGEVRRATADERGRAEMRILGGGRLVVRHPDHAPRLISGLSPPAVGELRIRVELEAGLTIAGWVLDPDGAPAARSRVRVVAVACPEWLPSGVHAPARAGEDGRFEVVGLLPGRYRVEVRPDRDVVGRPPRTPPIVEAGDRTVEILLRSSAALRIRLLDAESGRPVGPEACVTLVTAEGERQALWKHRGEVLDLEPPPGERVTVRVDALGYRRAEIPDLLLDPSEVGRVIDLRLVPDPESLATLTIVARDDRGLTIPHLRVERRSVVGGVTLWSTQETESTGGRTTIRLPMGAQRLSLAPSRVEAESVTFLARTLDVDLGPAEEREVEVVLKRAGSLRIVYPPDATTAGRAVMERSGILVRYADGGKLPRGSLRSGKTGAGERRYESLPEGRIVVELRRADGRRIRKEVEIRPGEEAEVFFPDE